MACSAVPPLATSAHGPAVSPVLATAVQLQQTYNQTGEAGQVRAQDPPDGAAPRRPRRPPRVPERGVPERRAGRVQTQFGYGFGPRYAGYSQVRGPPRPVRLVTRADHSEAQ
jgi:hypothetical protein